MSRFDQCLKFVLEREGGYVNHPADRGGPTNKGIVQKVYDQYRTFRRLERDGRWLGKLFRPIIDTIFWFDPDHCKSSYWSEVLNAKRLLKGAINDQ